MSSPQAHEDDAKGGSCLAALAAFSTVCSDSPTITDVAFGTDGSVQRLNVTFEQHCEGGGAALRRPSRLRTLIHRDTALQSPKRWFSNALGTKTNWTAALCEPSFARQAVMLI